MIFIDLSEKMNLAKRGTDETCADFVSKIINALNLLALPVGPRPHKAGLNAVASLGEELVPVSVGT